MRYGGGGGAGAWAALGATATHLAAACLVRMARATVAGVKAEHAATIARARMSLYMAAEERWERPTLLRWRCEQGGGRVEPDAEKRRGNGR